MELYSTMFFVGLAQKMTLKIIQNLIKKLFVKPTKARETTTYIKYERGCFEFYRNSKVA